MKTNTWIGVGFLVILLVVSFSVHAHYSQVDEELQPSIVIDIPEMEILAYSTQHGSCCGNSSYVRTEYKVIGGSKELVIKAFEEAGFPVLAGNHSGENSFYIEASPPFYQMVFHERKILIYGEDTNDLISSYTVEKLAKSIYFAH